MRILWIIPLALLIGGYAVAEAGSVAAVHTPPPSAGIERCAAVALGLLLAVGLARLPRPK